ncbi:Disease resistance protein RPP13 [Camellia lanceoleosa]|uniref:Disease resistance protein RPP13 n=1 Tax=Camellia lanceoleosa TaxID=1840588 RepID=A0ACC0ICI8_9ERIC|nr:Disease resistance protein RPP13 [Camellia lanceoleosa]
MNERFKQLRRTTPYEDDQHVVGFTEDVELLMSELLEQTPHQRVISIVGMGGLGNATLARKIYNSSSVGDKFECKGWVSVSKDYNIQNLFQRTIKSFKMPTTKDELEMLENMEKEDLECHLHELLKESRYLVVIDDVWDTDAWASLRRALLDSKKGSRVIITTHKKVVAESSGGRKYIHHLRFLEPNESWELFCRKVFLDYDGVDDKTNRCPLSLEELARDMVRKCRGLPRAIVVLGGLLSRKHPDKWPKLQGCFWRHIIWDNNHVNVRASTVNSQVIHSMVHKEDYKEWVLAAIYATPNPIIRDHLWKDLEDRAVTMDQPWLVAGDFNDYASQQERRSFSLNQNTKRTQKFLDHVNNYNVIDLGSSGPRMT